MTRTAVQDAVQAYRTQNTTALKALVGVRVVAALLGHSRLDLGKVARRPRQEGAEEKAPSAQKEGSG